MKTIIAAFLIVISVSVRAQNIDTVLVRNLQMQAQDWAWIVGHYNDVNADSLTSATFRRIRNKIQAASPGSWTTNVTIDSLPGKIALAMYQVVKLANAGEIAPRYTAITSAISGKANMTYFTDKVDAALNEDYLRVRERGKNMLLDE